MEKKELCKLVDKDILDKDFEGYLKLVKKPKFICLKCGRVAKKKKFLCKSKEI